MRTALVFPMFMTEAAKMFASVCGLHLRGDNFASTLREPAEPTIDSEDFDERLQAAVDQRLVVPTLSGGVKNQGLGRPKHTNGLFGRPPGGSKNHPGARS